VNPPYATYLRLGLAAVPSVWPSAKMAKSKKSGGTLHNRVSEIGSEVPVGSSRRASQQQRTQVIALTRFNLFQALVKSSYKGENKRCKLSQSSPRCQPVHLCRREHAGRVS